MVLNFITTMQNYYRSQILSKLQISDQTLLLIKSLKLIVIFWKEKFTN